MAANSFQITAVRSGDSAEIRIIGHIGWETDAEGFRAQVDTLVKEGVKDVHLYIHSPGGNCFDAGEIVNILSRFKGNITGEGGSLVASAATYIALHCRTFSMPANGMFMVHKPHGGVSGGVKDIEAYLKLMRNCEAQYYEAYKAIARDLTVFEAKWTGGADWWMTAAEALEQGFITGIYKKVAIDRETAAQIRACGCPESLTPVPSPQEKVETSKEGEAPKDGDFGFSKNNSKNETEMDLKTAAVLLGLPETATEAEVRAKLEANAKAAADLETVQAAQAQKEKTEKAVKIKAALDSAIAGKRIKADSRAEWEKMLEADFETAAKALESIAPVEKLSTQLVASQDGKKTYRGKTFTQLQDENPELLAELEKSDPEAFAQLFNETFKGEKK